MAAFAKSAGELSALGRAIDPKMRALADGYYAATFTPWFPLVARDHGELAQAALYNAEGVLVDQGDFAQAKFAARKLLPAGTAGVRKRSPMYAEAGGRKAR